MKIFLLLLLLFTIVKGDEEELKIYVFNCGQADCQLIVFPSGYSIMIDLGEEHYKDDNSNAEYVGERVIEILGKKEIDVLILSHYHSDHMGNPDTGGIKYFIEELGFTFKKFIDRDCGVFNGDDVSQCREQDIEWHNVGEKNYYIWKMLCYSTSTKDQTKLSKVREIAKLCSEDQIVPPDEGAKVQILMRDAYGVKDEKGVRLDGNQNAKDHLVSENDYSISIKITYGDFTYVSSGDLSGDYKGDSSGNHYHDIETSVAPMVGEVDLYHSNHHGIDTSTNEVWVKTLKPTVTVISCYTSAVGQDGMELLVGVGSVTYATNNCLSYWTDNNYPEETRVFWDDVVITVPKNSDHFTVSKNDGSQAESYLIKKNKNPGKCVILADD